MANTSKVIDLDRLARFKAKQDAANDAKFALKGEGGSIATGRQGGHRQARRRFRHHRGRHHQPVQGDGRQLVHRFPIAGGTRLDGRGRDRRMSLSKTPKSLTLDDKRRTRHPRARHSPA